MIIIVFLFFLFWIWTAIKVCDWSVNFFDGKPIGGVITVGYVLFPIILMAQIYWSLK
jgi:hypothetical protein